MPMVTCIWRKKLTVLKRVKNFGCGSSTIDTKETDVIANDDNYSYLGGMIAPQSFK